MEVWKNEETRLQVELAECIETKTVTTTTTTKRSYPPLLVRPPRSLESLDSKEYPLASKPTPKKLVNFSYMVGDELIRLRDASSPNTSLGVCFSVSSEISVSKK